MSQAQHIEPDWERLKALGAEIEALRDSEKWTRAEFERVLAEATEACRGFDEFTEFVVNEADPTWLE